MHSAIRDDQHIIMSTHIKIILDNLRSAHNVGSIFRTADGAGVEKLYLVGTTPTPIDRFGRQVPEIKKTSLGASEFVSWEHSDTAGLASLIDRLKQDGFEIVAIEQGERSISLYDFSPGAKTCYVLGNEIDGVGKACLQAADRVVEIPMRGQKESLNVSVAAGIVLFQRP